ncbi:SMC-Scp complex subunit ScpB [Rothia mucilaginosa]|uniref:SMC-Scp complex subunit ScpB n=1 Tax=Rothia mucilaginosa TaxID=43675 RepID=A0A291DDZ7_9MICC|nr:MULTISPECIES: SMC-Scp complex subunit ScpB [Rothia]ATF62644.1 SMC-Scp complex subunit ScpB [Rothia mucilaginosa]MBF1664827.1 SMC-Scp complex subunit ScpB [Rothia sp. (in: high G+C Gram-positive bacteria)]MBF1668626.1 SMC-Scp complex subunit ScpB [Rothia sp. (in: high G+C Gram-positive bacteria)]
MSNHGSRFDREFTPDDLAIVNMGYWDPNADEDSEQADSVPVEAVEAEISKPAEADAELAEHEVAAAPLDEVTEEAEVIEEAKEAEAAETVEDSDGSDISDSSEESQEPASRESEESVTKSVTKSAKIPAGGPSTAPSVAVDAEAEFSKVEAIPGGVKSAIEAILAVAEAPVSVRELSAALIVSERAVEHALDQLYREYNGEESGYGEDENRVAPEPRGFQLRNIAGGWKLYARDDFAPWVARFVTRSKSATLSKPAYETLAVIAYQQPVTRARVASIRGVNADAAIRQLLQRQLIREAGREAGSGATLYETTELLLAKLGLNSLEELPALAPFLPDDTEAAVLAEGND